MGAGVREGEAADYCWASWGLLGGRGRASGGDAQTGGGRVFTAPSGKVPVSLVSQVIWWGRGCSLTGVSGLGEGGFQPFSCKTLPCQLLVQVDFKATLWRLNAGLCQLPATLWCWADSPGWLGDEQSSLLREPQVSKREIATLFSRLSVSRWKGLRK